MKKLLITAALMSVFTLANANLAGASINGKQVRKGQSYGEVVAAAGQPTSHYDYVKNVGGKDVSVRELSHSHQTWRDPASSNRDSTYCQSSKPTNFTRTTRDQC